MVLNFKHISQPPTKPYNVVVRSYRDKTIDFLPTYVAESANVNHWLGKWESCTEINITNTSGATAVVLIEDSDWKIIVNGTITGGQKVQPVNGDKDFEVSITDEGKLRFHCLSGSWTNGPGDSFEVQLLPFQQ
ncbi:hypothetical protein ED733_000544 [Metarhizium rileyi]|uniref:Uncharacterized protein n=1 Tax=Metarhizium rileyi (strain RCEF 4871) TaxID=1649241 RepID=A0A5C6FYD8_METRR|nr:hypothetical protein ED733_000544 [Metarhizium rileyi]